MKGGSSSMIFGNPKHAREHAAHPKLKKKTAGLALAGGADAFRYEVHGCDGVAVKTMHGREHRVGVEVEFSPRNVVRNVTRDFTDLACDAVLIVAPTERMRARILAHMIRHMPDALMRNVFFVTDGHFSEAFFKGLFEFWLVPGRVFDGRAEKGGATRAVVPRQSGDHQIKRTKEDSPCK
jgi:hypothetical protein